MNDDLPTPRTAVRHDDPDLKKVAVYLEGTRVFLRQSSEMIGRSRTLREEARKFLALSGDLHA